MSTVDRERPSRAHPDVHDLAGRTADRPRTAAGRGGAAAEPARVTPAGADWLASASVFPRSVHALWRLRPGAPGVLPCGRAFDVVSVAPVFGRRLLDRLWSAGPGSGPVATHRGRMLLFAEPGTAHRLPALLDWEEWRTPRPGPATPGSASGLASLLCHGRGDAVTVPSPLPPEDPGPASGSRWLVAPDVRHPWLPGAEALLRACLRAELSREDRPPEARDGAARRVPAVGAGRGVGHDSGPGGLSIFIPAGGGANVYDVSRRR
ncbi:bifunctional DNA primase/polymerase [Streptomyces sp. HNM0574]|uniref:bifunctional DNA primase/polymerase n=1 Tax=Streptomyces sp. HNM0574 TaxID=2714954 RepID=UPI0019D01F45|nr:bifunctional DNA primase/polymerase [Streptomyces sp. HNM0574]